MAGSRQQQQASGQRRRRRRRRRRRLILKLNEPDSRRRRCRCRRLTGSPWGAGRQRSFKVLFRMLHSLKIAMAEVWQRCTPFACHCRAVLGVAMHIHIYVCVFVCVSLLFNELINELCAGVCFSCIPPSPSCPLKPFLDMCDVVIAIPQSVATAVGQTRLTLIISQT